MNRRFWSGKRAFVTGHTGFKGGWLSAWLLVAGARVAGYSLAPSSDRSIFVDAALGDDMASTIADVRDRAALDSALRTSKPEVVFHLAAQPIVRTSYEHPVETYSINVLGTAHVLDAARAVPSVRAVVVVTSDKCYDPAPPERRHAEDDPLGGNDPYSASKAAAEFVAASFRSSYFNAGTGVATARAGNVIGGGDWAKDRLLPDLLRAFLEARTAEIRRPDAIRPWQHVLDPIAGYLTLAASLVGSPKEFGSAWNFGPPPDHEITVGALADLAKKQWGAGAEWTHAAGEHPNETPVLRLDSTKAARELGWHARVPLESAVAWTIGWERNRSSGTSARDLLHRDFERFESLAS